MPACLTSLISTQWHFLERAFLLSILNQRALSFSLILLITVERKWSLNWVFSACLPCTPNSEDREIVFLVARWILGIELWSAHCIEGQGSAYVPSTPTPLFGSRQTFIPFTNFISFYCLRMHYSECRFICVNVICHSWWFLRSLDITLKKNRARIGSRVLYIWGKWYATEVHLFLETRVSLGSLVIQVYPLLPKYWDYRWVVVLLRNSIHIQMGFQLGDVFALSAECWTPRCAHPCLAIDDLLKLSG